MNSRFIVIIITAVLSSNVYSQDMQGAGEDIAIVDVEQSDRPQGWSWNADLTLGGNILSNKKVVGQPEGQTNTFNGKINLGLNHLKKTAEWENLLTLDETFTRTPYIDRTIKTGDLLALESIYKYFFTSVDWLGAFGSLKMETSAFDTYDERSENVDYAIASGDSVDSKNADRLRLSPAFRPMTLKQSIGAVFRVIRRKDMQLDLRTGPAARQMLLRNQYFVADDIDTPQVEIGQYNDDLRIVGWVMASEFKGTLKKETLTYKFYGEALMPLSYHPKNDDDLEKSKLVSTELGANLSYKLIDWISMVYDFKAKREPLLQPEAQITHNFMLTATLKTSGDF